MSGTADLAAVLAGVRGQRVVVVGDPILDVYVEGTARGLCREAPVPLVDVGGTRDAAGGAANVAANVAALGGEAALVAVLGRDGAAARLRLVLEREGVDLTALLDAPQVATAVKTRVLAAGQLLLRYDAGAPLPPGVAAQAGVPGAVEAAAATADAAVISDYRRGVVDGAAVAALAAGGWGTDRPLVVDAREPQRYRDLRPAAVTPNYQEAVRLLGLAALDGGAERVEQLRDAGAALRERTGARMVAVTLDTDGVLLFEQDRPVFHCSTPPARATHGVGAGDAFAAALACALACGTDPFVAVEFAAAAAAVATQEHGTALCRASSLERRVWSGGKELDLAGLARLAAELRRDGRQVVFTNGCFDLLHGGHVSCLGQARELGDVLVVGVNDDTGVRRLKGPGRPVTPIGDRLRVLAALSCVDYLVPFADDSPTALIEALRPDVYVKGGDYTRQSLPEAPLVERLGGRVHIVDLVADRSTTGLIERLRGPGLPG